MDDEPRVIGTTKLGGRRVRLSVEWEGEMGGQTQGLQAEVSIPMDRCPNDKAAAEWLRTMRVVRIERIEQTAHTIWEADDD